MDCKSFYLGQAAVEVVEEAVVVRNGNHSSAVNFIKLFTAVIYKWVE
jgi:hypothetical protein